MTRLNQKHTNGSISLYRFKTCLSS